MMPYFAMSSFQRRLLHLTEMYDLSFSQQSVRAGLYRGYLNSIFSDHRLPSYDAIKKLSRFYKVSSDYLIGLI